MKGKILGLLFTVSVILTVAAALQLLSVKESAPAAADSDRRYVFLAPNTEEKYWIEIAQGVKAADMQMGSDTLLVHYLDQQNLAWYIRDAYLSGARGIIVKGDANCTEEIKNATEAGVPVLFYDSDFPESGRTSYVGNDNYEIGVEAARALLRIMGEKGSYLIVTRAVGANSQKERVQGVKDVLSAYPEITYAGTVEDEGELINFRLSLQEYLDSDEEIRGIVTLGGVAADNLGKLLQNFGVEPDELAVVVTDFSEQSMAYLQSGEYDTVISLDTFRTGYRSVELLNEYYEEGKAIETETRLEAGVVTADNLAQFVRERDDDELEWNSY